MLLSHSALIQGITMNKKPSYIRFHRTTCLQESSDCIEIEQMITDPNLTYITIRSKEDSTQELFVTLDKDKLARLKEALNKFE